MNEFTPCARRFFLDRASPILLLSRHCLRFSSPRSSLFRPRPPHRLFAALSVICSSRSNSPDWILVSGVAYVLLSLETCCRFAVFYGKRGPEEGRLGIVAREATPLNNLPAMYLSRKFRWKRRGTFIQFRPRSSVHPVILPSPLPLYRRSFVHRREPLEAILQVNVFFGK